ncbi:MAG TPA: hypothetical protein VF100_11065, partial [Thermoanaerobaculia bacterium]
PVALATTTTGVDFVLRRCSASSIVELANLSILGARTHEACRSVVAGPNVTVGSSGTLMLRAGESVVLGSGFRVLAGGRLAIEIDPAVASN